MSPNRSISQQRNAGDAAQEDGQGAGDLGGGFQEGLGAEHVEIIFTQQLAVARSQDLRLTVECPAEMPTIEGDARRLKQALCNLVSNAIKFTPSGGSIRLAGRAEGDTTILTVTDTGVGIPGEDQERVFEAFARARPFGVGRMQRSSGPGLGLSLVKHIFELHGGRVWLESTPGRGTTVVCTLPARVAPMATIVARPADAARA